MEEQNHAPQHHTPPPQPQPTTHGPVPDTLSPETVTPATTLPESHFQSHSPFQESQPYQTSPSPSSPSTAPEVVYQLGFYQPQPLYPGQHRSLSPTLSQGSTNFGSPHLGSAFAEDLKGKEVYSTSEAVPRKTKRRVCGLPLLFFCGILAAIIIIAGLAAGLGAGLGLKHHSTSSATTTSPSRPKFTGDPDYYIGGAIDPAYYSTKGAFNGSGIAFAGESWVNGEHPKATIYFQHHTGDIRFMRLSTDGRWIGGSKAETVVTNARNSTPLSTVSYGINATSYYHLFYLDKQGYVRQKTNTNTSNIWQDGYLNKLNLKAFDANTVGMQACWYGNFYGDSDFKKFPTVNGKNNTEAYAPDHGMHLWYAIDETTFKQYGYFEGQQTWVEQKTWAGFDGHAGVGCYSWGPGSVSYAMFVNLHHSVELWWKDTNSSLPSVDSHPINSWQNASNAAIPNVHPSTSLGFTTLFFAQQSDLHMKGYNISFNAENSTISEEYTLTVGDTAGPKTGLSGSHMTISAVPDNSGGASFYVFYQTIGNDVTVFTRDLGSGPWSAGLLPIPDD